ncbi:MAG: membrane protein insertion efficiency factor YidD [Treponema sp.]|nr:membrane protein insertion efficiency factor YidD [Treponema sp.]MCL2237082.1 membrane protein insertion efficiency factor YidD [Treponema sp.]
MKYITLIFIRFYQYAISPHFPRVCRYYPTCSAYAYEAVSAHGFIRGCYMAAKRILRCHPFHRGGYDPVPEENLPLRK